jgi:hypothetical protein
MLQHLSKRVGDGAQDGPAGDGGEGNLATESIISTTSWSILNGSDILEGNRTCGVLAQA